MKPSKNPEAPNSFSKAAALSFNQRVADARAKLKEAKRDRRLVNLSHLTPDEREFALKTAHLPDDVDLIAYCAGWLRAQQRLAMPRLRDYVSDLLVMVLQPEMLSCLLGRWMSPPRSSTGPKSAHSGSKAVMLLMGALGLGAHVDNNVEFLRGNPEAQDVLACALNEAAQLSNQEPEPFQLANSTDSVRRHLPKLAQTLGRLAMQANVLMLRSLAAMNPHMSICEVAGIDGTAVAAWIKQTKGFSEDEEADLRHRVPQAGFRFYSHDGGGKHDVADGEKVNAKKVKLWRGYYLVVLVDYCTGRPIVWTLVDASRDEAKALPELLSLLYEFWPDCPLKTIVSDGAWDEKESHRLCEVNYGIHLVASRTREDWLDATHSLSPRESKLIASYNGRGEVFCRKHGKQLRYLGNEFPKRAGLAPGEPAPEAQFRLRFKCECEENGGSCGTVSLQMRHHWSAFAYYPHNAYGVSKRYAERHALLAHRNRCESLFNALKVGHGLATVGADRLRLRDFDSVHAMIDLSFCMGTALMLGHERDKRDAATGREQLAA
ncbi:MAG: hypothetical protein QOH16_3084 [Gaiellaceae bacterium]|nr:hypothetical protein [Gaiellaceae bacterium]